MTASHASTPRPSPGPPYTTLLDVSQQQAPKGDCERITKRRLDSAPRSSRSDCGRVRQHARPLVFSLKQNVVPCWRHPPTAHVDQAILKAALAPPQPPTATSLEPPARLDPAARASPDAMARPARDAGSRLRSDQAQSAGFGSVDTAQGEIAPTRRPEALSRQQSPIQQAGTGARLPAATFRRRRRRQGPPAPLGCGGLHDRHPS
jgi:hypothetical protein